MKKIFSTAILFFALFIISASAAEGDYIIKFRKDAPVFFTYSDEAISLGGGMQLVPEETALALKDAGLLEICDPDRIMTYYESTPDDTDYSQQWNLPLIKAEYAWSLKTYGNDVLVGIIDSGLDPDHPDIDYSRVVQGYNFAVDPDDGEYNTKIYDTSDTVGHGTKVSGTIVAKRNNSLGLAGIADKVKLIPLKCADNTGAIYDSTIINAIYAGAGYFGCDVLNISLGMGVTTDSLNAAIKYAIDRGCIVVAAAGNDTAQDPGDHIRYPAGCDGVISVGSTTHQNTRAESSVTNESVFICAPAASIPLLTHDGGYTTAGGTSFAAPQVAAAAAIAKSIDPYLTPTEFALILQNTATLLDDNPERDIEFGYGLLNIEKMVKYMLTDRSVYVSPFDEDTCSVTLFNLTSSDVTASSIFVSNSDGKMVYFDPQTVLIKANNSIVRTLSFEKSGRVKHLLWKTLLSAMPYDSGQYMREMTK